jgi:uncharacterized membrane protein (UPF0182 family)
MLITIVVLVVIFLLLFGLAPFWINWLWFGSMGYRSVLFTGYVARVASFLLVGLIAAAIFGLNLVFALRNTRDQRQPREGIVGRVSQRVISTLTFAGSAVVFLVAGYNGSSHWEEVVLALRSKSFGVEDPTFGRDVSFYVFSLPVMHGIQFGLAVIIVLTMIAVAMVYLIRLGVRFQRWGDVPTTALRHLSGLLSALLLVFALGYLLRNYDLVFSTRGSVIGPGFTDVNVVRPLNWLMALASVLTAIGLLSGVVLRTPKWLIGLLGSWAFLALILTPLLPQIVQRTIVEPSEFSREQKYIQRNIEMTQMAWGLDTVETSDLSGQGQVDPAALPADQPPLSNVRIWDYRVVGPIYQQLQTFVPWYEFNDVDIDQYQIDGQPVQLMLSARELNPDALTPTWSNTHLSYTHGYGLVVSPVSQVSSDGWPEFLVSGIQPNGTGPLEVTRPEIYYGEQSDNWIIVHTDTLEFSGLEATKSEASAEYSGLARGSISLGNPVTRILAALTLNDRNVFLSSQLTGDSRLILDRSVVDRAKKIAPFLEYDPDPYLVVVDGRLVWVIDAYTTSSRFPQATKYEGINYIRNSVKVVVDAYDGTTTFYRTDVVDPIADAWGNLYDDLFTPVAEAPATLTMHFRYPERQFSLQSRVWADYHVTNARTYYDGDDRWTISQEEVEGEVQPVEPFFVTQVLPGDSSSSFALTIPFTPGGGQNRQNMTAWFAGTADATGQTRLRLYRYPREVTVYGPRQIEAQINQDPDIAQQISLWNQGGSRVIRGNLLVIPIGDATLYVQPLYLQASGSTASAPRLARVIVATNQQVVMRDDLAEAIAALENPNAEVVDQLEPASDVTGADTTTPDEAQPQATPTAPETTTTVPPDLESLTTEQLANEALATYERSKAALREGDWNQYGIEQERLKTILELLAAADTPVFATPEG